MQTQDFVQLELDLGTEYRGSGRKPAKASNLEKTLFQAQKQWRQQLLMTDKEILRLVLFPSKNTCTPLDF